MLAAAVIEIAAGLLVGHVNQEPALEVARSHNTPDCVEIPAGFLLGPARAARGERLQIQRRRRVPVAGDACRMAMALLEQDWLDLGFEELVTQRRRLGRRSGLLREQPGEHRGDARDCCCIHGALHQGSRTVRLIQRMLSQLNDFSVPSYNLA